MNTHKKSSQACVYTGIPHLIRCLSHQMLIDVDHLAHDAPIAIVQWTHTLRMKPMLLVARRQVLQVPFAEHHVVLSSCGMSGGQTATCEDLLAQAQPELVENVTCHSAHAVAADIPAFLAVKEVLNGNTRGGPDGSSLDVGTPNWCWNSCDGPYLHWYNKTGHRLRHVHFFWFLEWDVVWTGDIVPILSSFSEAAPPLLALADNSMEAITRNTSTNVAPSADHGRQGWRRKYDLMCPNPGWANFHWTAHRTKRDTKLVNNSHVYRCVTNILRMTPRLLGAVLAFSQQKRGAMFCEMRSASICSMNPWCTMGSFFDRTHAQLFHTSRMPYVNASNVTNLTEHQVNKVRQWWVASYMKGNDVQDAQFVVGEPLLYHAYKWAASGSATRSWLGLGMSAPSSTTPIASS